MPRVGRTTFGLHRYGPVLRAPGARRIALGALVARSGQIGLGLASLLAVRQATGSYGAAGTALGASALAVGLGRVAQGRVADRVGTARVLVVACVSHAAAGLLFLAALEQHAGSLVLVALTGLLGASIPAVAAITRTLWTALLPEPEHRTPAHTIDSALTELSAMIGPAIAGVLTATTSPATAVIAMAALGIGGGLTVATVRDVGIARGARAGERGALAGPLAAPILTLVVIGVMVGALELAVPAFADDHDQLAASGLLIALWGSGSIVSGLLYGAHHWRPRPEVRLVACLALMTAGNALLPLAGSLAAMAMLLVLAGIAFTPAVTTLYVVVDHRVPHERKTEAFAWVTSAMPGGIALGTSVGGWAVSLAGASAAFRLTVASSALGLGLALWLARAHSSQAQLLAG
jgi:predicted MFS family arabinose efflux permease